MKKIFFFDIDGTLTIHGKITESNLKALKALKEKGHLIFICTGRAPFYANRLFEGFVDGIICCNGRYILYQGKKIHGVSFSQEEKEMYMKKLDEHHFGALLVSDHYSLTYGLTQEEKENAKNDYGKEHICDYQDEYPIYTLDIFYHHKEHFQELVDLFKDELVINDHGGMGHCDCSTSAYDKGSAIAFVLNYFHLSKEDAYAFGDGYNDQAMFREVKHKIAMGNAVNALKQKATYITDTIENEGIYKALIYENIL